MSSFWKIFISVVVTAIIVGGGIFYVMGKQIDNIRSDNQTKMDDLSKQIATLKSTTSTTTTPVATTTPATTDATAGWKTYTSSGYNYSVKYPTVATYSELSSTGTTGPDKGYIVDFANVNNMTIRIEATKNTATNLKDLIASNIALNVTDRNSYTQLTVGGQPAYKYIGYLDSSKSQKIGALVLVLKDDYYYQISTGSQYSPEFTSTLESAFDQFVSTFQFTK